MSDAYLGEVLRFTHQGKKNLSLEERLFYETNVLGVSIVDRDLKPGETTTVYRVKTRTGGGL